ncbi:uncharacterized protein [Pleurodeles waltl]|uniref:uncharacterized protein isoform X3 n=1 Tax=Pleurodeles waltl TaxID=8319 RepID=UPI0037093A41
MASAEKTVLSSPPPFRVSQRKDPALQQAWTSAVTETTWQIQHLPGSQLVTADYLSRHPVEAGLNQPFARGSVCNRFTGIQKSQAALGPIGECPRGSVESIQCSRQHVSNENKEEEEMHREAERETEDAAERAEERKHKRREDDAQGEQLSDWRWRGKREQGSPERSECRQQRQSPVLGHDNLPHPRRDVASADTAFTRFTVGNCGLPIQTSRGGRTQSALCTGERM